jgi:transglutaminase-like putative cysteine protease
MNWRRIYFLLVSVFSIVGFSPSVFSQDAPITWGEIPKSDLEMKSFLRDTNASIVILYDYGESFLNDELDLVFQRHVRIKILTTKGYEWGTESIGIYTKDDRQSIRGIEGATYALDEQGKLVKHELQEKDIFTEVIDNNRTRYKFTMPALKPGCIIEYRYKITANSWWMIQDWRFQHSEPVRWSEYRVRIPKSIAYAAITHGYEPYAVKAIDDTTQYFHGSAENYFGRSIVACYQMHWILKDAHALRDEPFITTIDDYYNRVDLQLSEYALRTGGSEKVIKDWGLFNKDLLESKYFGECIDVTRRVRKKAEEITSGCTSPEEKIRAIYNWITQSIVWTQQNRLYAEQEVNDVLESKKGNNADINFLLLSMLKSVDIQGDPVIVSTHSNGKIQELYPILSQFNYVLARVSFGSQMYYIDATDPLRPMELLPPKVMNVKGFVIKKDGGEWVTLTSPKQYSNVSLAMITLHEDGTLDGTLEDLYRDYASLSIRRKLKDKKELDIAKESFENERQGITIDSVSITGRDSIPLPLTMKAWISAQTYAQSSGDNIYINPMILHRMQENPFKDRTRKFPVEYPYQQSNKTIVNIAIPEGFEIKENLMDRMLYVGRDFLSYSRKVLADQHGIQIITKLDIHQIEISEKYYDDLKSFYTSIVAAEAEQIVLSRIKKTIISEPVMNPSAETKPLKKKGKK